MIYLNNEKSLLSHGPSIEQTFFFNTNWDNKDRLTSLKYLLNFRNRSRLSIGFQNQFIQLLSDFDPLRNGISTLQEGTEHNWNSLIVSYEGKPQNRFTYSKNFIP